MTAGVASPRLSVVIPVYGNWWLTARCLRELERLRDGGAPAFETIVVDNASPDETPRELAALSWVRYLPMESNRNFAGACNAGVRAAQAEVTLLLNNDAYPLGDAFSPLLRAFERREVAIAGGALFFEDGVTQAAGLVLLRNAHWHYSCRNLPPTLESVMAPRDAQAVSGAAMAVRTQWFVADGGFDETFVNGFEDVDLCMRARAQGRAIAYVASSRFAHYEGATAGRFDREADNERRFYERWSSQLRDLPRTARGAVGAVAVHAASQEPLLAAALADLEEGLRSFGHPVVRGAIAPWRRFDRRFALAASLSWFESGSLQPGISVTRSPGEAARIRTRGAASLEVAWLPCAAEARVATLPVRVSSDPACDLVAIAGSAGEIAAASRVLAGVRTLPLTAEMLLGRADAVEVACVVHAGLTDDAAFGNVLLAQAGLPAVVAECEELRAVFAGDVALFAAASDVVEAVERFVGDTELRARFGRTLAGDARRRFSPRRSAIRVVDLLCAARFGLERPGERSGDTPL